jgi:hypothetical protein
VCFAIMDVVRKVTREALGPQPGTQKGS